MQQNPYIIQNPPKRKPEQGQQTYWCNFSMPNSDTAKTYQHQITLEYSDGFLSWEKTNFTANQSKNFDKIDRLYHLLNSPLNTLKLGCKQGTITKIYQLEDIEKKWKEIKRKVEAEYNGAIAIKLISIYDNHYSEPYTLQKFLQTNPVLQLFYRAFLDDYLVYYGKSYVQHNYFLPNTATPVTLKGNKTLNLTTSKNLELNYTTNQNGLENTSITDTFELDYKTVWIKHAKTILKNLQNNNEKQTEITLRLI